MIQLKCIRDSRTKMSIFIGSTEYTILDLGYDKSLTMTLLNIQGSITETPEMVNVFTQGTAPRNVIAGELITSLEQQTGVVFSGKTAFDNTQSGYRLGIENNLAKFYIGNTTDYINWDGTDLTIVGGVSIDSLDIGGSDATSFHVDVDGNMWLGAATFAAALFRVSNAGVITSTSGTIGGWTLGANALTTGSGATTVGLDNTVTGGDDIRIYAGSATPGSAPFRVTETGAVTALSITITGGTIDGTSTLNGSPASDVQPRAETLYEKFVFIGSKDDGLTETAAAGASITRNGMITLFNCDNSADAVLSSSVFSPLSGGASVMISWGSDIELIFFGKVVAGTLKDVFMGVTQTPDTTIANDATLTERHYGFFIDDTTCYASNANATTQTRTDITASVTITNMNTYRIVVDAGTNVKFYVNDSLLATHTTNLPSGTETMGFTIGCAATGTNGQQFAVTNNYSCVVTQA